MNKFPVYLLRQLLNCMQDGLSIRVTAQKLGIFQSSVSLLFQTALSHGGGAKVSIARHAAIGDFLPADNDGVPRTRLGRSSQKTGLSECHAQIAVRRL